MLTSAAQNSNENIRAKDVVTPILLVLAKAERLGFGPLTSRQLEKAMLPLLVLSEEDSQKAPDRVTKYSRVVRNIISSHKTLENQGLVRSVLFDEDPQVYVKITAKGRRHLVANMLGVVDCLPSIAELNAFSSIGDVPVNEEAPTRTPLQLAEYSLLCLALLEKDSDEKSIPIKLLRRAVNVFPGLEVRPEESRSLTRGYEVLLEHNMIRRDKKGLKMNARGVVYLLNNMLLDKIPQPPIPEAKVVPKKIKSFGMR